MNKYYFGIKIVGKLKEDILKIRKELIQKNILEEKESYFPHITLYPQGFDNEEELIKKFDFFDESCYIYPDRLNTYVQDKEILHIKIKRSPELIHIQGKIIDSLYEIRNNEYEKTIENYELSEEEYKMLNKYGYPFCKNCFTPHITLGSFKEKNKLEEAKKAFSKLDLLEKIKINKIYLAKLNDEGLWEEIAHIILN